MENNFNTKQELVLHLEAVKEAANTIEDAVRIALPIIRKFHGKQFTRRVSNQVQKAVDEALGEHKVSIIYELTNYHFGIEFYLGKRAYPVRRLNSEVSDWHYFDGELCRSLLTWNGFPNSLDADEFQARAETIIRTNRMLVYKYADAAEHFDEYRKAYADAVRTLQESCGAINPVFLENMVYTSDTRVSKAWLDKANEAVRK